MKTRFVRFISKGAIAWGIVLCMTAIVNRAAYGVSEGNNYTWGILCILIGCWLDSFYEPPKAA